MTLRGYRIVKEKLVDQAFSGEGARRFGGRWNQRGTPAIYLSSTISLAMLEMLVHLQSQELMLKYVVFPVDFDEALVTDVNLKKLPRDWDVSPVLADVQQIGEQWITAGTSAVLRVPSAIVHNEFNYIINPQHHQFNQIKVGKRQQVTFDHRFK